MREKTDGMGRIKDGEWKIKCGKETEKRGDVRKGRWIIVMAMLLICSGWMGIEVRGAEASQDNEQDGDIVWNREASGEEWNEIDEFLRKEMGETDKSFLFADLVSEMAEGGGKHIGGIFLSMVKRFLFQEIAHSGRMVGELLALGLIGAIFSGFSHIFAGGQISETAFFMTYLLAFTMLMAAFTDSVTITREILTKQTEFMKILLPSYFLAVAWAGGSASAIAWMELVLFLIGAVQWLYLNLLLPLTRIYILLVMAGNMVREELLTKLTGLLQSVVRDRKSVV